jgi:hypothetical protein
VTLVQALGFALAVLIAIGGLMAWHASQVAAATRVETIVAALTLELKEFRQNFQARYDGFDSRLRYVERILDLGRWSEDVVRHGEQRDFYTRSDERLRQIMRTVALETLENQRGEMP